MGDGNATKAALLEAAKELIRERGYAGTSVRELAAASGTNLAAVNYHFGSREKLLNQALLETFLEWTDQIVQEDAKVTNRQPAAGPLEHLAAGARPLMQAFPERLPLFVIALEALLQAQRSPELREHLAVHYAEQRRRVGEMVTAAMGVAHAPPDRRLEVAASFMIAVTDGLMVQALLDPEAVPTGDELAAFYEGLAAWARVTGSAPEPEGE
jgi:AcrR family transcriptional regulator